MHISHLRKKLECGDRELIKTIRGSGYQFCRTREEAAD
jgi:DNA-binding response OmpR family regulator